MATVQCGYLRLSPDGAVHDTLVAPKAMTRGLAEPIVIHTRAGRRSPFPEEVLDALSPFGHDAEVVTSRGSRVWGILRGALDEEYVVSWRIE